ncbi:MAG: ArsR/SmtB family transcription factor [Acidimicrobiales bacterium]
MDLDALERVGIALADPTRRQILARLAAGPAYPGQLADALQASPASVSNHLACLRGCGLVTATAEGRRVRYDLADVRLAQALRELASAVHGIEPGHHHARKPGRIHGHDHTAGPTADDAARHQTEVQHR